MTTHRAGLGVCALLLATGTLSTAAAPPADAVPAPRAAPAKYSQAAAAQKLRQAGISWSSSGRCSNRNNRRCTSFDRINRTTVAGIIAFKKAGRCAVTITGGTETGHAGGRYSHWNGYKVDIALTRCVNTYIPRAFRYAGRRGGDNARMYKSPAGNLYAREGSHWDILYYNGNR